MFSWQVFTLLSKRWLNGTWKKRPWKKTPRIKSPREKSPKKWSPEKRSYEKNPPWKKLPEKVESRKKCRGKKGWGKNGREKYVDGRKGRGKKWPREKWPKHKKARKVPFYSSDISEVFPSAFFPDSKKRSLLKEWPENLGRKLNNFLNFYRLIPPDDLTHTKRCSTLTPRSHIYQTVRNEHAGDLFSKGPFFSGNIFRRTFF